VTPRCRGYGVECFEAGEELCAEGLNVITKGEGSVKNNVEELGSGIECKGSASQSELGLMRAVMGIYRDNLSAIIIGEDFLSIIVIAQQKFDLSFIVIAYAIFLLSPINYYRDIPNNTDFVFSANNNFLFSLKFERLEHLEYGDTYIACLHDQNKSF